MDVRSETTGDRHPAGADELRAGGARPAAGQLAMLGEGAQRDHAKPAFALGVAAQTPPRRGTERMRVENLLRVRRCGRGLRRPVHAHAGIHGAGAAWRIVGWSVLDTVSIVGS